MISGRVFVFERDRKCLSKDDTFVLGLEDWIFVDITRREGQSFRVGVRAVFLGVAISTFVINFSLLPGRPVDTWGG